MTFRMETTQESLTAMDVEKSETLTKIAVCGLAYATTEVYMMTDYSVENRDTWRFLERQVNLLCRWDRKASEVWIQRECDFARANDTIDRSVDRLGCHKLGVRIVLEREMMMTILKWYGMVRVHSHTSGIF